MTEVWKDIQGYEGLYQISNLGRVKSLKRNLILKQSIKNNYKSISLCKNNYSINASIHRLVSQAFIPNPENKPEVNHIDGNKLNNRVDNLEWVTKSENVKHAYKIGLNKPSVFSKETIKKLSDDRKFGKGSSAKPLRCVETSEVFDCIIRAALFHKIDRTAIGKCCNGKLKTAGGLHWEYVKKTT